MSTDKQPTIVDVAATPQQTDWRTKHAADIQKARDTYSNNDLEIDDTPLLAPGEGGVWINAWVWIATDTN